MSTGRLKNDPMSCTDSDDWDHRAILGPLTAHGAAAGGGAGDGPGGELQRELLPLEPSGAIGECLVNNY